MPSISSTRGTRASLGNLGEEITISTDSMIYKPGQHVSGKVYVKTKVETRTRGLLLKFEGKVQVRWTKEQKDYSTYGRDGQRIGQMITKYFDNMESLFVYEKYLFGDGKKDTKLMAGNSTFGFSFKLPPEAPVSITGEIGSIEYILEAHLPRPLSKYDLDCEKNVQVTNDVDLNENPDAAQPGEWTLKKTFCCLCCTVGPITVIGRLATKGFCPAEAIPVEVEVNNLSKKPIKDVVVEFVQQYTYIATDGKNEVAKSLVTATRGEPVGSGQDEVWTTVLRVPSVPPSNLGGCKIITVEYFVKITASLGGRFKDLIVTCPVIIGTIPLKNMKSKTLANLTNALSSMFFKAPPEKK